MVVNFGHFNRLAYILEIDLKLLSAMSCIKILEDYGIDFLPDKL